MKRKYPKLKSGPDKKLFRKHKNRKGIDVFSVRYQEKWLSFAKIIKHPDFVELNLTEKLITDRYKTGKPQTIEIFMRPKKVYKKREPNDNWFRKGCSDEQWEAMAFGTNEDVLNCKS